MRKKNYGINAPLYQKGVDAMYNKLSKYRRYGFSLNRSCNVIRFASGVIVYDYLRKMYIATDGCGITTELQTPDAVVEHIWDNDWAWI